MLGPRADGPSLAAASHVDRSATQSVTPRRYYKCSAAAGTPPHLAASLVSVFHSHSVAGNTAHAAFFRNRVSGHVSERHAFGQTVCSCLTASCHAAATAGRVWVRPRWASTMLGIVGRGARLAAPKRGDVPFTCQCGH